MVEFHKEVFSFTIALLVIGSFVWFFWWSLSEKPDIETAKEVTALYGGYVAAVLVYYFGQKQAQNLTSQAVKAEKERDEAEEKVNDLKPDVAELINENAALKKKIRDTAEALKRLEEEK